MTLAPVGPQLSPARAGRVSLLEGHAPARAVPSVDYGDELRRA